MVSPVHRGLHSVATSMDMWIIAMTSHERHVVSNDRPLDCLFHSLSGPTSRKHQSPHYWPFVRGINRSSVISPHKGPVTQKKLSLDDVIIWLISFILVLANEARGHRIHCNNIHTFKKLMEYDFTQAHICIRYIYIWNLHFITTKLYS